MFINLFEQILYQTELKYLFYILILSYLRDIYVPPTKKIIIFKQITLSTFTLACFKEESSSYIKESHTLKYNIYNKM